MRVLVTGSRDWVEGPERIISTVLTGLFEEHEPFTDDFIVIEGEASGVDSIARDWVEFFNETVTHQGGRVDVDPYPADWNRFGKAAGPIRNKQMLVEGKPDLVVAFSDQPTTRGTANMIAQGKKAGVPIILISRP